MQNENLFLNILLYADDIILLTSNENDLQFLLNIVENWCKKWRLEVNLSKTNVMHVRNARCQQSKFMFLFNHRTVNYCKSYKYLGSTINEFLNFNITAEAQAEAAGRSLGALITKTIKNGGLPFKIYTMLYECTVNSVSDYGSEIWGFELREAINKIHLRAARSFLGLPKHATSSGVMAEINWPIPKHRAHVNILRHYFRVQKMEETRLTKKICRWDTLFADHYNVQTWASEVKTILHSNNLAHYFNTNANISAQPIIQNLKESLVLKQNVELQNVCHEKPKLRTYVKFMEFGATPSYILMPMSFLARKFIALLRLSNLAIRLETGRFERPRLEEHLRLCPACVDGISVENEHHVLFSCVKYGELRQAWLSRLKIPDNFLQLNQCQQFKLVLNESDNVKTTAQFIIDLYNIRSKIVNK